MRSGLLSFLLGFTLTLAVLGTLSVLGGCSVVNKVTTGNTSGIPTPGVGQWVAFGGNENQVQNNTINFNCCSGSQISGYYYTALPFTPQVGQTLTFTYTLAGSNMQWTQVPASGGNSETDINPPTLHVFLWRKGDNLSCTSTNQQEDSSGHVTANNGGYADYRLFAADTQLQPGMHTITVPLDPTHWTNCWGMPPLNLQDELNNLLGMGFTFGGQYFAGHGIYLSGGSASFIINNFSVQ